MYHAVFLFNYDKFRQEAKPFVDMADKGEFTPIIIKANEIADQISPEAWILHDMGTTLNGFKDFQKKGDLGHIIGFSFLVLLSEFLKSCPLPTPGLGNVAKALQLSNWSERHLELLRRGMSTTVLLKPSIIKDVLARPPAKDSRWHDPTYYWWWLRPQYAFYTGWWDVQQLIKLRQKLLESASVIDNVDFDLLKFHPSVSKQIIQKHYDETIQLFDHAIDHEVGLLAITK